MSNFEKILPEACYNVGNMTFKDVEKAFKDNMTVVGYVEAISQANESLTIRLGDELTATLPFCEATMYPLTYSQNNPEFPFPLQVGCLKEKIICAKVKAIKGHKITLSRKDNMLEVLELIKNASTLPPSPERYSPIRLLPPKNSMAIPARHSPQQKRILKRKVCRTPS